MRLENKNAIKLSFQLVHGCISSSPFLCVFGWREICGTKPREKRTKNSSRRLKVNLVGLNRCLALTLGSGNGLVRIRCACMTHHKNELLEGRCNKQTVLCLMFCCSESRWLSAKRLVTEPRPNVLVFSVPPAKRTRPLGRCYCADNILKVHLMPKKHGREPSNWTAAAPQ